MGLIPKTGRKSVGTTFLMAGILFALTVGAVTMVIPFLLMLTASTHTQVDRTAFTVWPRFLGDENVLFQKFISARYNESPSVLRAVWETDTKRFQEIQLRESPDRERAEEWRQFLLESPPAPHEIQVGFTYCPASRGRPWNERRFMRHLYLQTGGSVSNLNDAMQTSFADWNAFRVLPPDTRSRLGLHADTAWWRAWNRFVREEVPDWSRGTHHLSGFYRERIQAVMGGEERLSSRPPQEEGARERWELFVREVVHPGYVRFSPQAEPAWQSFLQNRYVTVETFQTVTGRTEEQWEDIPLPASLDGSGALRADWLDWLIGWQDPGSGNTYQVSLDALHLVSADLAWRQKHGEPPPYRDLDQLLFEENRSAIRRLFLFQNYGTVWEILIVHGRGLWVTVLYCGGAVLIALIVNPMAAYALSRYRPRHTYALLLYLLLTMAFPPMVTQIPLFLMLRDLNLLNTFWALWLPGMAHGYSIFLLKGFFDSLPRDLYESASLDGAGEMRMFVTITLSLSKPILAVIALSAFVNAYTSFMFALLICQDESMWTLMVWLYQMQQQYGSGVMNAAFVLAAIPTLVVFLAAQRQILRGIVVPSEK